VGLCLWAEVYVGPEAVMLFMVKHDHASLNTAQGVSLLGREEVGSMFGHAGRANGLCLDRWASGLY
jgi:hypothetical protein